MKDIITTQELSKKERIKVIQARFRLKHRERLRQKRREYEERNRKKIREQARVLRQTPKYKAKQSARDRKRWADKKRRFEENPEAKEKHYAYMQALHDKRMKESLYASKYKLRKLVAATFERIKQNKPANTLTLLGCSWEEARAHIESQFKEGMNWQNHGEWHLDHIKPVNTFNNENLHLMNHITNLRPLWAHENLARPIDGRDLVISHKT